MGREDIVAKKNDPEPEEVAEEEEEDLVDPLDTLKEQCGNTEQCQAYSSKLQECTDRVNSRKKTEETCVEELMDYFHCVDNCLVGSLFSKLK